jgi:hypothetical protein
MDREKLMASKMPISVVAAASASSVVREVAIAASAFIRYSRP